MKHVLILIFLAAVLIQSGAGQSPDRDCQILAEYAILEYTLQHHAAGDWADSIDIKWGMDNLTKLVESRAFKYTIDTLYRWRNYDIVSIIDKTNFQLHGLNTTIYAIDRASQYYRYQRLEEKNLEVFITDLTMQQKVQSGEMFNQFIDLYNAVYFYLAHDMYRTYLVVDSNNTREFEEARSMVDLSTRSLYKFSKMGERFFQERAYKVTDTLNHTVTYYLIRYVWVCERFSVEREILVRHKL